MIVKDLIDSQVISRDSEGFSAERSFLITDAAGTPDQKLYNAILNGQIPQYGSPHPLLQDTRVTNITASPMKSPTQIMVKVIYSVPTAEELEEGQGEGDQGLINVNSNLVSEEDFFDINNNPLSVQFVGSLPNNQFAVVKRFASVEVQRPQLRITLSRTEDTLPKEILKNALGKINAGAWSGFPAQTWLISGINVREDKGKFAMEYSFSYRAETWKAIITVAISDADAEAFPLDIETGNGYARYDVYKTFDFNQLGLLF